MEISVVPPNEVITTIPVLSSLMYRGSGANDISVLGASFIDPFPLIEIAAVPVSPVLTVSPEKIVASAGAGVPFMDTDPVEVIEPIDCGICVRVAAGARASEETAQ